MPVVRVKNHESRIKVGKLYLRRGFTLIELLIAISIIGVVFGAIITSSFGIQARARDTQRQSDLSKLQTALQQYYSDQNYYPRSVALTGALTSCFGAESGASCAKTYLSTIPADPSGNAYCYQASRTANVATTCDNSAAGGYCQYYRLSANLESGTANGSCPFNFVVTPQN